MNTLSKADLLADHKAALGNTLKKFTAANDADFERHLNKALLVFSRLRRRTLVGELTLQASVSDYDAPADMVAPKVSKWGQGILQPWDQGYAPLPKLTTYEGANGPVLHLHPAPTAFQVNCFGSKYTFFYLALHQIGDLATDTTFKAADRALFLLLASIEAVQELALSGVTEPVTLHRGMGVVSSNMTPAALLESLTKQLERYA